MFYNLIINFLCFVLIYLWSSPFFFPFLSFPSLLLPPDHCSSVKRWFIKDCALLAPCPACAQVVEVAGMPEHLLEECDMKELYVSCDVTGELSLFIHLFIYSIFLYVFVCAYMCMIIIVILTLPLPSLRMYHITSLVFYLPVKYLHVIYSVYIRFLPAYFFSRIFTFLVHHCFLSVCNY